VALVKKCRVTLTALEREERSAVLARGEADVCKLKHAQVLLHADRAGDGSGGCMSASWTARRGTASPSLPPADRCPTAEIELGVLGRQCLARRIAQHDTLRRHAAAWDEQRNNAQPRITWQFTTSQARITLRSLYPSSDGRQSAREPADYTVEGMTALILAPPPSPEETFVPFDQDQPVGTAGLVRSDLDAQPDLTPWLAGVFVQPAFRRRGDATVLARQVETFAAAASVPALWLYTSTAEMFHVRLGKQRVGMEQENGHEVMLMRLPVQQASCFDPVLGQGGSARLPAYPLDRSNTCHCVDSLTQAGSDAVQSLIWRRLP